MHALALEFQFQQGTNCVLEQIVTEKLTVIRSIRYKENKKGSTELGHQE